MENIQLSKGGTTVTIHTIEFDENRDNDLTPISLPQPKQKQANGPKDTKILDLLKLTIEFKVVGHLDETNRNKLITLTKGAGTSGAISMIYSGHPDSPLSVFMSKCQIKETAEYKSSNEKYETQLTLIEGVAQ